MSSTFRVILTYSNKQLKDLCVQWLQDQVSLTFNVVLTYGCLSGPYTNDQPPEDDDLLVETYAGAYISFNIKFSNSAFVGIC
jgi:hypothetical protein